jgi:hypothetical protein
MSAHRTWHRVLLWVITALAVTLAVVAPTRQSQASVERWGLGGVLALIGLMAFRELQVSGEIERLEAMIQSSGIRQYYTTGHEGLARTKELIRGASESIRAMVHFGEKPDALLENLMGLREAIEEVLKHRGIDVRAICTVDFRADSLNEGFFVKLAEYEETFEQLARTAGGRYEVGIRSGPAGPNFTVYDKKKLAVFFPAEQAAKQHGFVYDSDLRAQGAANLADFAFDFFERVWPSVWRPEQARNEWLRWKACERVSSEPLLPK